MMPFRPGFVKTISWLERILELFAVSGFGDAKGLPEEPCRAQTLSARPSEDHFQHEATANIGK